MDNLMKLLGKSEGPEASGDDASKKLESMPDADMAADGNGDDGFDAAAEECMTALQGGDSAGFAEALKHCIELSSQ